MCLCVLFLETTVIEFSCFLRLDSVPLANAGWGGSNNTGCPAIAPNSGRSELQLTSLNGMVYLSR